MMSRTSPCQARMLVQYMKTEGDIGRHTSDDPMLRRQHFYKWEQLVNRLNSCDGVKRSTMKWRRIWSDMKANAKKKAARIRLTAANGRKSSLTLNSLEMDVLSIMKTEIPETNGDAANDSGKKSENGVKLEVDVPECPRRESNESINNDQDSNHALDSNMTFRQQDLDIFEITQPHQAVEDSVSCQSLERCKLDIRKRELDVEEKKIQLAIEQCKHDREHKMKQLQAKKSFMDTMLRYQQNTQELFRKQLEEQCKITSLLLEIKKGLSSK